MNRELNHGTFTNEVDNTVMQRKLSILRIAQFELKYLRIKHERPWKIARPEHRHRSHAVACAASMAAPTRSIVDSSKCLPSTCTPMGRPSFVVPKGTLMPQMPASEAATE